MSLAWLAPRWSAPKCLLGPRSGDSRALGVVLRAAASGNHVRPPLAVALAWRRTLAQEGEGGKDKGTFWFTEVKERIRACCLVEMQLSLRDVALAGVPPYSFILD